MSGDRSEGTTPAEVWGAVPSQDPEMGPAASEPTYYGRPMLKEPVWIWAVPAYFFTGGVAGAAAVVLTVAPHLQPEAVAAVLGKLPLVCGSKRLLQSVEQRLEGHALLEQGKPHLVVIVAEMKAAELEHRRPLLQMPSSAPAAVRGSGGVV